MLQEIQAASQTAESTPAEGGEPAHLHSKELGRHRQGILFPDSLAGLPSREYILLPHIDMPDRV